MTRNGMTKLQDQMLERVSAATERGNELTSRITARGSELREQAVGTADRAYQALSQVPKKRWVPYELVSLASGVVGGALAGAIFNRIWRAIFNEDEVPEPAALERNIREVLIAGALQGAVFGLVKAALGRITARGYRQFIGSAPKR